MRRLYMTAVAVILLASCSVKEERDDCPCLLNLDFDTIIDEGRYDEAVTTIGSSSGYRLGREMLRVASFRDVGYEISVPRRMVNTSVVCGCSQDQVAGDSVVVGTSAVMAFARAVHCRNDREFVSVTLHKQFARLQVQPEGFSRPEEYPFGIRLNACTNALGIYDLQPCGVGFHTMLTDDLTVNIPRQPPQAALSLDMFADGPEPVFSVDLSTKLSDAGYDWAAEDLADILVTIDFARMSCNVTVLPWDENSEYRHIEI